MLEKNFSNLVVKHLKKEYGAYVIKAEGLSVGMSDLLVCYNGKFVAIELKGDGRYDITPAQTLFLKKIREAGGISFKLKHSKEWKEQLHQYLNGLVYKLEEIKWD